MTRLDILVSNQMGYSREMAKELIKSGFVAVGGRIINRPGAKISEDMEIIVNSPDEIFVSRGGYKLRHGLKAFDISVSGLVCLDIGAAAGGFTDCLLRRGAVRVIAVDNGRGQLAARLCADPRVVSLENTDIRNLHLDEAPDFAVCDVSFIPLARVIPAI
ncbi:MAG: S4 domain-containing protein, partial [Defluviitaleaceae bacterium]|nr:S4 domain-containing protein [Defluviitaleaceae bacterium]